MFCSKCGTQLPDDALFCIKCGQKTLTVSNDGQGSDVSVQQNVSDADKYANGEGNAKVSKNLEEFNVKNMFSERVNSEVFATRTSQNKLFTLYSTLIPTLKEIEKNTSEIQGRERRIASLRDKSNVKYGFGPKILAGIFVLVFIIQFFNNPIGDLGEFLVTRIVDPLLKGIDDWFVLIKIPVWIILAVGVGFLVTPLFVTVICALVWLIYFRFVRFNIIYNNCLKQASELEKENQEIIKKREGLCHSIVEELKYVPKKYRYSHALEYFVDLYNSSRVDTLKEAVNIYVTDMQAQNQEQHLKEIAETTVSILWNVEEMVDILRSISGDVSTISSSF